MHSDTQLTVKDATDTKYTGKFYISGIRVHWKTPWTRILSKIRKVKVFLCIPTCAELSFEKMSFENSKDSRSKDGPAQFGPISVLWDAIADSTLSSKQVVPHPSKHNLFKCHDLDPESTV